jgi:hypothetical protein
MNIKISEIVDPDIWEPPYILESLRYLSDLSDDYNFIIARTNNIDELNILKNNIITGKKNVLILLSDEVGINNWKDGPYFMRDELHCIFRTYNNRTLYDNEFIYPIPCGFSCGVGVHSEDGNKNIYRDFNFCSRPLKDRKYDIFFSGQLDSHRKECLHYVNKISNSFNCLINPTTSFAKGFSLNEYYDHLENSKIAIVPRGVCVPESFRYFESMKSGCIIISSYPVNDKNFQIWYYEKSSAIFLENWSQLTKELVEDILQVNNLNKYDLLNKEYFESTVSPKSLSIYIRKILENHVSI